MFLDINDYILFESVKLAREVVTKAGKDPNTDPDFLEISKILRKNPALLYKFTQFRFDDNIGLEQIINVSKWILNNKDLAAKLPKKIVDYDNFENLLDDVEHLKHSTSINQFYTSIYKSMRDKIEALPPEKKKEWDNLAAEFMNLKKELRKTFTPLKYFEANNISLDEFKQAIQDFVEKGSVNSGRSDILEKVKEYGDKVEIVYDDHNVLVLRTEDKKAVCEFGSSKWCIVYAADDFHESYMGEGKFNTQYIIFNFNLPSSSENSMFGVTIQLDGSIKHGGSQNKLNSPVSLSNIIEMTEIPQDVLVSRQVDNYNIYTKEKDELAVIQERAKSNKISISEFYDEVAKFKYKKLLLRDDLRHYFNQPTINNFALSQLKTKSIFDVYEQYPSVLGNTDLGYLVENTDDVKKVVDIYTFNVFFMLAKEGRHSHLLKSIETKYLLDKYGENIKDILSEYNDYFLETLKKQAKRFNINLPDDDTNLEKYSLNSAIDKCIETMLSGFGDDFTKYKSAYDKMVGDDYTDFFTTYFSDVVYKYYQDPTFVDFLNEHSSEDFSDEIGQLDEDGNFDNYNKPEFREFVASLAIHNLIKYKKTINNTNYFKNNHFLQYAIKEKTKSPEYAKIYYDNIKVKRDEKGRFYVTFDDYSDLNQFYENKIDWENYQELFEYDISDKSEWRNDLNLDLENILMFAKLFKKMGFKIDENLITKYSGEEYKNMKYHATKKLIREDKELYALLNEIESIISDYGDFDTHDEELYSNNNVDFDAIESGIAMAHTRTKEESDASEYISKVTNELGDFFNRWEDDSDGDYKGRYVKWVTEKDRNGKDVNKLALTFDVDGIFDDVNFSDLGYSYGKEFDVVEMISEYFNQNGKLNTEYDNIYGDFDDNYFNEILRDEIENQGAVMESMNMKSVLKFNDYIKSITS